MLIVIACMGVIQSSQAATTVSGTINANTTWSLANSPIQITADVTVSNGVTLSIEAGTVISFDTGTNLIISNGALSARGTAGQPITFTSTAETTAGTPVPGNWGQIQFLDGSIDSTTIVEYANIKYGNGISVQAASPTFNYLNLTQNLGSTISIDLNSSPKGVGNQASGNTLNGISVPAGDVNGSVTWGIKGIPYIVASGIVSVGATPVISAINPAEIQQSLSIDAVISGTRLSGADSILFDSPGVSATVSAGGSNTSVPVHISASAAQPLGPVPFQVNTAAGKVRYVNGINVIPLKPTIVVSSLSPGSMRRAESKSFQISGTYLNGAQVTVPPGIGLSLSSLLTTDTQASFNITSAANATLGSQPISVTNPAIANGTVAMLLSVVDSLPQINTNTLPAAVIPDAVARTFQLSLTHTDTVDNSFSLSTLDPTIVSVSPAAVTIPAGSLSADISIAGMQLGYTTLNITSPTLQAVSKQIYASNLLNGASVGPVLSAPVGLVVPYNFSQLPLGTVVPVASKPVGVDVPYNLSTLLPIGTVVPVASLSVGVDVPYNPASLLPVGTVVPLASAAVGVDVPFSLTNLPIGSTVGPILSLPVGITVP